MDTPTLRGLIHTAPYLHDGSAPTLYDVLVTKNPADQHGITSHLTAGEITDLIAFLEALPY
jgi:cytochrome c peroxidase